MCSVYIGNLPHSTSISCICNAYRNTAKPQTAVLVYKIYCNTAKNQELSGIWDQTLYIDAKWDKLPMYTEHILYCCGLNRTNFTKAWDPKIHEPWRGVLSHDIHHLWNIKPPWVSRNFCTRWGLRKWHHGKLQTIGGQ